MKIIVAFLFLFGTAYAQTVSISPFPYDITAQSDINVDTITDQANLYTIQLDSGIPWQEALDATDFTQAQQDEWADKIARIDVGQEVYLAVAPYQNDRITWAHDYDGATAPVWVTSEPNMSADIRAAYENYVIRAVQYFSPDYVNFGLEAGRLITADATKWTARKAMFEAMPALIRAEDAAILSGISWELPNLMAGTALADSASMIAVSDFVCLSFYPHLSDLYVANGAAALYAPPKQWRNPLRWARYNITKQIAICETGMTSKGAIVPGYPLSMYGNIALQSDYVGELEVFHTSDNYLFTVFFLTADYTALMIYLGSPDLMQLWENVGFYNADYTAKTAWTTFQTSWLAP